LRRSLVKQNTAAGDGSQGGGVWCDAGAVVESCLVTRNSADAGGGIYTAEGGSTLVNSALTANSATMDGGGVCLPAVPANGIYVDSCTISGNSSGGDAGGIYGFNATIRNSILTQNNGTPNRNFPTFGGLHPTYCMLLPLLEGNGNQSGDPQFLAATYGDFRLTAESPCSDAGTNLTWMLANDDLEGKTRIVGGTVDMGAHELRPLTCGLWCDRLQVTLAEMEEEPLTFTSYVDGAKPEDLFYRWDFDDDGRWDREGTGLCAIQYAYPTDGTFSVRLEVHRNDGITADYVRDFYVEVIGPRWFVSPAGSHTYPYTNWVTAATNVQPAIDASAGQVGMVLVTDGVYAVTSPLSITNSVVLRSVNGPDRTEFRRVGTNEHRVLHIANPAAAVEGFTLSNGRATGSGEYGGGALLDRGGTLRNCILRENAAEAGGGAGCVYGGVVDDCVVVSNTASQGGGVAFLAGGRILDSSIVGNVATSPAAGGGGLYASGGGTVQRCRILDNRAPTGGGAGGAPGTLLSLHNCLVAGNVATTGNGGGLFCSNASLWHCTVTHNEASRDGGGLAGGSATIRYSVVTDNTGHPNANVATNGLVCAYSCVVPKPAGDGNLAADPLFVDVDVGDFRLLPSSPCIDAGLILSSMFNDRDVDGLQRVRNGAVDLGCHEFTAQAAVSVALQGPFEPIAARMRTDLSAAGRLVTASPYASDRAHRGIAPSNIVDWVLVELLQTNGYGHASAHSALLLADGSLVDPLGAENLTFEVRPNEGYALVVKHRNHGAVTLTTPLTFAPDPLSVDFTTGPDKVLGGTNACVELAPGVWGMIAGDCDGDGKITEVDREIVRQQVGKTGYLPGDCNLDGVVTEEDVP